MTTRARPPSPLPSLVAIAALLSASATTGIAAAQDAGGRPSIIVRLVDGSPAKSAEAFLDGATVPVDEAFAVDPGEHTLMVAIDGRVTEQRILVREGEHDRVVAIEVAPRAPAVLGGVPPRVERGGCCGATGTTTAMHDLRATSAAMVLATVLAARRRKRNDD